MASWIMSSLGLALLLLSLSTSAQVVTQFNTTKAFDGAASDQFGWAVATHGSILAVGAPWTDFNSSMTETGSIYLYDCSSFPCSNFAKASIPDPSTFSRFGFSLALTDSLLLVGARGAKISTFNYAGAAYLYSYSSSSASAKLITKLTSPTPKTSEYFGSSVSLSGSLLAIGASDETSSTQPGGVYLYKCSEISCTYLSKVTNPAAKFLGWAVASDDGWVIAGAYGTKVGIKDSQGAAYLFDCSSTPCIPGAILTASDGMALDQFGYSVAIQGELVVIGATQATGMTITAGVTYVFRCPSPSSCSLIAKLYAPDGAVGDYFGVSVAIRDFTVVVGARNHDVSGKSGAGAAYLYDCFGFSCHFVTSLSASDPASSEYLGISAAFLDRTLAIGAYQGKVDGIIKGFVKHFDPTPAICSCSPSNSLSSSCASDRQCQCAPGWTGRHCTIPE